MTPAAYRTAIAALGLTQVGAARVLGVDPRTSRRWAAGDQPVPHAVRMVLHLLTRMPEHERAEWCCERGRGEPVDRVSTSV